MCGIVGYVGRKFVDPVLVVDLERLEYRGYDSAGIATLNDGELCVRKRLGRLRVLDEAVRQSPLGGTIGIGHTRWATHGEPSEMNAHPHLDCRREVAIVHNGIIENYAELRAALQKEGHVFTSDTDSEVIAHLIEKFLRLGLERAVLRAVRDLRGSFAFAAMTVHAPDLLVAAKLGSSLLVGLGDDECFIASDETALCPHVSRFVALDDGQIASVRAGRLDLVDFYGQAIAPEVLDTKMDADAVELNGFDHFMLKEIHEEPQVVRRILERYTDAEDRVTLGELGLDAQQLARVSRVVIQACGTSWHAGLIGKRLLEGFAHIHTEVDISSEFRYRNPILEGDTLVIALSQSGETADTLAGIRQAKSRFMKVLSICNVATSSIARESDAVIDMLAGPEIGVASTKAYIAELVILNLLALHFARIRWTLDETAEKLIVGELRSLPEKIERILANQEAIVACARAFTDAQHFAFLGRGYDYPTALEGALKLKEISYIHATGYPAGEFKHGPIALVEEGLPVVCIATRGELYDKMLSNIHEVRARRGAIIAVTTEGDDGLSDLADFCITVPECSDHLEPILSVVPLQLLAYHVATLRGCDVDKPRNLAKSVTVE
ncbi:MAG TPA: glutamine--fructose-6-phosphate transaminase (isomerizing) [Planctomycetota bacterium]|nr:glutamine--fructose-6-phosphate transaminase (isomerizing) [Planctomycetota bacterium]